MPKHKIKFSAFILSIIILSGILLRFTNIGNFYFQFEQSEDVNAAKQNWTRIINKDFSKLDLKGQDAFRFNSVKGQSNQNFQTQIYHGVNYFYLLMIPGVLSDFNPKAIVVFLSILGSISVILFALIVNKKFSSLWVKLTLISVFSFSSWLMLYSRWIWTPSTLPFWTVLIIYLLEKIKTNPKSKLFYLVAFLVGLTTQIHISAALLIPTVFIYSKLNNIRIFKTPGQTLLAGILFLIPIIPLLIYELTNNFVYFQALLFFLSHQNQQTFSFSLDWIKNIAEFFNNLFSLTNNFSIESFILLTLLILIILRYVWIVSTKSVSIPKHQTTNIVLFTFSFIAILLLPGLLLVYYQSNPIDISVKNNFIVVFPVLLLLFGKLLDYKKLSFITPIFTIIFLAIFIKPNLTFFFDRIFLQEDSFNYIQQESVVDFIYSHSNGKKFDIVFLNPNDHQTNNAEIITIFETKHYPLPEHLNSKSGTVSGYSDTALNGGQAEIIYQIFDNNNSLLESSQVVNQNPIFETQRYRIFAKIVE